MILSPYLNPSLKWLGLAKPTVVAGLHIAPSVMTLVALRGEPGGLGSATLISLGRESIPEGVIVGTEIRSVEPLTVALRELMTDTRIERGTPLVVTIEPLDPTTTIAEEWEDGESCHRVSQAEHDRTVGLAASVGLDLVRVDIVPAALARFARQMGPTEVALRAPVGWSVVTNPFYTDAERVCGRVLSTLNTGTDLADTTPLTSLVGVEVPEPLQPVVDPGLDAVAVGAAMAGFGLRPLVTVNPVDAWPPPPVHRRGNGHRPAGEPGRESPFGDSSPTVSPFATARRRQTAPAPAPSIQGVVS